jgi:predicted nicotinamide N-methyase
MDYEKYFPIRSLKLVPEIRVRSVVKTVQYPVSITNDNAPYALPYWHSQALARFILDNPHTFVGQSVVDIGCGTGVAAIAAAMVGAQSLALDPDLRCLEFTEQNASTNNVAVETVWADHRKIPDTDIVLAGGVFHEAHGPVIAEIARNKPSLIAVSEINLWDMDGFVEVALHQMDKSTVRVFRSKHLAV